MRVIGVDPGVARTGYAVVDRLDGRLEAVALGVITTPTGTAQPARLASLADDFRSVIRVHRPEVAAVERLFFNSNVRTAMSVGQASGVVLASLGVGGIEVFDYTPSEVKSSIVGVGNCTKQQVQAMVKALLRLAEAPSPPDVADACAVAITHLNRSGLNAALRASAGRPRPDRRTRRETA